MPWEDFPIPSRRGDAYGGLKRVSASLCVSDADLPPPRKTCNVEYGHGVPFVDEARRTHHINRTETLP